MQREVAEHIRQAQDHPDTTYPPKDGGGKDIPGKSLSVLNEGRDDDPESDPDGFLWGPARLFAAVQHRYGTAAVGGLYDRYGAMAHGGSWGRVDEVLAAAGLSADLVTAWDSPDHRPTRRHRDHWRPSRERRSLAP